VGFATHVAVNRRVAAFSLEFQGSNSSKGRSPGHMQRAAAVPGHAPRRSGRLSAAVENGLRRAY